jgi:fatty acid amide hydrolase 2
MYECYLLYDFHYPLYVANLVFSVQAASHFESLGCTVKRVALPQFRKSFAIWSSLMATSGNDSFCSRLSNGPPNPPINPYYELLLWLIGRRRHTLPAIGLGMSEKVQNSPEKNDALRQLRDSLRSDLENLLGDDGVFLYPTHPRPAPFHHETVITLFNFAYAGIFNVMGLPVTAVPMGIAPDEQVPIGIQVAASRFNDRLPLAVAVELENTFGGWVPPFEVDKRV